MAKKNRKKQNEDLHNAFIPWAVKNKTFLSLGRRFWLSVQFHYTLQFCLKEGTYNIIQIFTRVNQSSSPWKDKIFGKISGCKVSTQMGYSHFAFCWVAFNLHPVRYVINCKRCFECKLNIYSTLVVPATAFVTAILSLIPSVSFISIHRCFIISNNYVFSYTLMQELVEDS